MIVENFIEETTRLYIIFIIYDAFACWFPNISLDVSMPRVVYVTIVVFVEM